MTLPQGTVLSANPLAAGIGCSNCWSLAADPNLQSLDWDLGLTGGEELILLTEWAEQPTIAALLEDLPASP